MADTRHRVYITGSNACYNIDGADGTADREINALVKASNFLKCKKMFVITDNAERTITRGGKKIEVTPLWKWLLN